MTGDRRAARRWLISVITVLALITLVVVVFLFWSGIFGNVVALIPRNVPTQTTNADGGMSTPTPTGQLSAPATMTALQPATPPAPQIKVQTHTFIPAVVNLGVPAAIPTELPPETTSEEVSPTDVPQPTKAPYARKTILVDISEQHVYAYEKGELVFSFVASTGRNKSTRVGRYKILDKIPRAYSDPWGFWMPYWMGIYYAGNNLENGFHSLPVLSNGVQIWGKKIGTPITYGCVVLKPDDMKKLYRWAGIGTAVVIQK
jgi:lipoprotein-anchoring transpeptidase ErfK/SrfK